MSNAEETGSLPARIRLHKYMAACGVASRRACEALIAAGRVQVDGVVITAPGTTIDPARQIVRVDGREIRPQSFRYVMVHKPRGVLSAMRDARGRRTLADLVGGGSRLFHVGRLDQDSEGLLLLTNDGDLALRLTHPRYGVEKTYHVWCDRPIGPAQLDAMMRGIRDGGELLRARSIAPLAEAVYEVVLAEGKKREIRRLFAACGARVARLLRVAIGPLRLGELPAGASRELTPREVATLREALCKNFHAMEKSPAKFP